MSRVLVTGAAGFLGAHLARHLLDAGRAVELAVRPGSDRWRIEGVDAPVHEVDLADGAAVGRLVAAIAPAEVHHLAAHGGRSSQTDRRRIVEANVLGTVNVLDAAVAAGVRAVVVAGSSSEYGVVDGAPAESARLEPNSLYAATKAAATHYARHVARSSDLDVTILRVYSAYGPLEDPSRLVPTLIAEGLAGRLPPLVDPATARDLVHVDDVVGAFVAAAGRRSGEPGAVYNIGSGRQTTVGELVEIIRRLLSIEAEPIWRSMEARRWDATTWIADPSRAEAELGWRATIDLEAGLARTIDRF